MSSVDLDFLSPTHLELIPTSEFENLYGADDTYDQNDFNQPLPYIHLEAYPVLDDEESVNGGPSQMRLFEFDSPIFEPITILNPSKQIPYQLYAQSIRKYLSEAIAVDRVHEFVPRFGRAMSLSDMEMALACLFKDDQESTQFNSAPLEKGNEGMEVNTLIGELFHYFSIFILYHISLHIAEMYRMDPFDIIKIFFPQYEYSVIYHEDGTPVLDSMLSDKKQFDQSDDYKTALQSAFNFDGMIKQLDEQDELFKNIIIRTFRDFELLLGSYNCSYDHFIPDIIRRLQQNGVLVKSAYSLYRELTRNLQYSVIRNFNVNFELRVLAETDVRINFSPNIFKNYSYTGAVTIANTKKTEGIQSMLNGLRDLGYNQNSEYIRVSLADTITIDQSPEYSLNLNARPDFVSFYINAQGEYCANIIDHKLSLPSVDTEQAKINAFLYRVIAAAMIYRNTFSANKNDGIVLSDIDLNDPILKQLVIYNTSFSINADGNLSIIEPNLTSQYYDYCVNRIQHIVETSIVYPELWKRIKRERGNAILK